MKNDEKKIPPVTINKKPHVINPEEGSGKQDREQGRDENADTAQYGDDFALEKDEMDPRRKESVTFEQDIQNERENDVERDSQKRSPLGEDPSEIAKQGKEFEPGIDEGNKDAI